MYNAYLPRDAVAITPSDTAEQGPPILSGVYVGGAGDVTLVTEVGTTTTFKAAPVGATIFMGAAAMGGPNFLTPEHVERIHNRPDEAYRQKQLKIRA